MIQPYPHGSELGLVTLAGTGGGGWHLGWATDDDPDTVIRWYAETFGDPDADGDVPAGQWHWSHRQVEGAWTKVEFIHVVAWPGEHPLVRGPVPDDTRTVIIVGSGSMRGLPTE